MLFMLTITATATVMAWVKIAKNTPRTRLRKTKNPITAAARPGMASPIIAATGKYQNGFQNHGTVHIDSGSPTSAGYTRNKAAGILPQLFASMTPSDPPWWARYIPRAYPPSAKKRNWHRQSMPV